jgi:hypothetical protein
VIQVENFLKEKKMKKLIVMVASLALVASFAMTAAAADWNFYGSARVNTWWTDVETIGSSAASVEDFAQALQGNSRIGANVKVSDELSGRFEYGTGVNVRLLYGVWNFGAGSFLVGQTYTPLNMFYSNQVFGSDTDMLNTGGVYGGRQPVLQLQFGSFKIAAVAVEEDDSLVGGTVEATIPAIEASYSLSLDPVSLLIAGGYQTYETNVAGLTYDVDAWVLAFGASANFGAFYLKGDIYFGQNPDNLIWSDTGASQSDEPTVAGGVVNDVDAFGYLLVVGGKINDMFAVEAGYGTATTELDNTNTDNDITAYYVQATITMAPGVFVVPEIGVIDGDESGESETTYFGAKWQINF